MIRNEYLGELEHVVLLAVARLGPGAYGMSIRREIFDRTSREVAIGAVYATLERLLDKEFVDIFEKAPEPGRDRRARRFVELTRAGERALLLAAEAHERMWEGLRSRRVSRIGR